MKLKTRFTGFTLAELLVALLILGAIAMFTIPKVLSAQQNGQNKAVAKEFAAMISGAYQQAQLDGIVTTSTSMGNMTQYMNYVARDTTSTVDTYPNSGGISIPCSANTCYRLHNGAIFVVTPLPFGTTSGVIYGIIDPDGGQTGQEDSIVFAQKYDGRLTTYGVYAGDSSYDPDWFSW